MVMLQAQSMINNVCFNNFTKNQRNMTKTLSSKFNGLIKDSKLCKRQIKPPNNQLKN